MRIRQYIELAINGCDCRECLDAIIRTAEEDHAEELATLRAENERMREALESIANGDGIYGAQAWEYKQIALEALK